MRSEDIAPGRLYGELAWLLPLFTPPEDYAEEAVCWRSVLRERLGPGRHAVLELGVGGGHNLSHLANEFRATAVDLSPDMLALCRRLNPGVELHQGDMRSVRLGRTFRAVLIHDAISYMITEHDLLRTLETAAAHLEPGGVLVAAPDRFAETFQPPQSHAITRHADGILVHYTEYTHDPDPADTSVETLIALFVTDRSGTRVELDRHVTGLFPRATWARLFAQAGFALETRAFPLSSLDVPYELLVGVLG
ncbi:class I SAM-dependent methyltransferase [Desulfocurvus vexinensis]|uniref:class I SAM-dependent methyltransferase n=1 Tax=Desulfocurvus vexinensis TaxID=399548 RepID=UPI0004B5C6DB|nr:class I SAM-dependent methyltransferase [Desulfocurvus vexinensis]